MNKIKLRDYQERAVEDLFQWMNSREGAPILDLCCGAGKSIIIAEMVRRLWADWGSHKPRCLVIVPSKELAEQNAEKLRIMLPTDVSLGYYSAAIGKKQPNRDVIVATIGSVAKKAHILGNIKMVVFDECHAIPNKDQGTYRSFLNDLSKYCNFITVGLTGTPFRGDGVWLTDGESPLFSGIAHKTHMGLLLERGYLKPLVRPRDVLTQIDTSKVSISRSTGDYSEGELGEVTDAYLDSIADDTIRLAADRKCWLAFVPTVANAEHLAQIFRNRGIACEAVHGKTGKDRKPRIDAFRSGQIRCVVTVLALTTGFDHPDIDCIIWARETTSPVLYVQGGSRGVRLTSVADDCLWLDFTTTTQRLGPIDQIRGRAATGKGKGEAPFAVCDNCGAQVRPASLLRCPECDYLMREEEAPKPREVSEAPVMSTQVEQVINAYDVTEVTYDKHNKAGKPPSMKVTYWSGFSRLVSEYVCFEHGGYAASKAYRWWAERAPGAPKTVDEALDWIDQGCPVKRPIIISINETGKYPSITGYEYEPEQATA